MRLVGVDIGGSGIKGARVDVERGELVGERTRLATPSPATPDEVLAVVAEVVEGVAADVAADVVEGVAEPIGVAFPGVVRGGVTLTAANLDPVWIGVDLAGALGDRLGRPVLVLNDADAAGLAEMRFGAGRDRDGVVVVATLGTGIGTAVFSRGVLVPNTELGHLPFHGGPAEHWAAANVRKREGLGWHEWADRLDEYLGVLDLLLNPDVFVLGGGVSRKSDRWLDRITSPRAEVVVAALRNRAGIVGAALAAAEAAR